jgi:hypothetical protein
VSRLLGAVALVVGWLWILLVVTLLAGLLVSWLLTLCSRRSGRLPYEDSRRLRRMIGAEPEPPAGSSACQAVGHAIRGGRCWRHGCTYTAGDSPRQFH